MILERRLLPCYCKQLAFLSICADVCVGDKLKDTRESQDSDTAVRGYDHIHYWTQSNLELIDMHPFADSETA